MSQLPNEPLRTMTKTQLEMQDFSWKNIRGFAIVLGVIVLGAYIFKKKK